MNFKNILYEKRNGVAIIEFNRPEKKNAISLELTEELRARAYTEFAIGIVPAVIGLLLWFVYGRNR